MNPAKYSIEDIVFWTQMDRRNQLATLPPMPDEIRHLLGQQPHRGTYASNWPQTKAPRQDRRGGGKTRWKDGKGKGKSLQTKITSNEMGTEPTTGKSEASTKAKSNSPTSAPVHNETGTQATQATAVVVNTIEETTNQKEVSKPATTTSSVFTKGLRPPKSKATAKVRSKSAGPLMRMAWSDTYDAEEPQREAKPPTSVLDGRTWPCTETETTEDAGMGWEGGYPPGQANMLATEMGIYYPMNAYGPHFPPPPMCPPYTTMLLPSPTTFVRLQEDDSASTISVSPTDHQLALTDIPVLQCRFYQIQEPEVIIVTWKEVLNEKKVTATDFVSYLKFINQQLPILDAADMESGTKEIKEAKKCADLLGGSLLLNSILEARTTAQQLCSLKVNARQALLQLYESQLVSEEVKEKAGTPTWNHMSNTLADFLVDTGFIEVVRTYLKGTTDDSTTLYSCPGQLDLFIELEGKLYHDDYYPNDQIYRLNTKYRVLVGNGDLPTLEKWMRTDIIFPSGTCPPPQKIVTLDTNWSVKPKGLNRGLQCDITSDCALFLDQIDAFKRYSRWQSAL